MRTAKLPMSGYVYAHAASSGFRRILQIRPIIRGLHVCLCRHCCWLANINATTAACINSFHQVIVQQLLLLSSTFTKTRFRRQIYYSKKFIFTNFFRKYLSLLVWKVGQCADKKPYLCAVSRPRGRRCQTTGSTVVMPKVDYVPLS